MDGSRPIWRQRHDCCYAVMCEHGLGGLGRGWKRCILPAVFSVVWDYLRGWNEQAHEFEGSRAWRQLTMKLITLIPLLFPLYGVGFPSDLEFSTRYPVSFSSRPSREPHRRFFRQPEWSMVLVAEAVDRVDGEIWDFQRCPTAFPTCSSCHGCILPTCKSSMTNVIVDELID